MKRHLAIWLLTACAFGAGLPFVVSVARAITSYASGGAAYVHGFGKTTAGIFNIARDTRYPGSTGPCGLGDSQLLVATHNATLTALHAVFGPMPGTYTGPYPTVDEATTALRAGERIEWRQLSADEITVLGRQTRLKHGVGQGLVNAVEPGAAQSQVRGSPRASIWHDQVLLLELPRANAKDPLLVFVDRTSGKVFAYEGALPQSGWNLPRQWQDE